MRENINSASFLLTCKAKYSLLGEAPPPPSQSSVRLKEKKPCKNFAFFRLHTAQLFCLPTGGGRNKSMKSANWICWEQRNLRAWKKCISWSHQSKFSAVAQVATLFSGGGLFSPRWSLQLLLSAQPTTVLWSDLAWTKRGKVGLVSLWQPTKWPRTNRLNAYSTGTETKRPTCVRDNAELTKKPLLLTAIYSTFISRAWKL